MTFKYQLLLLGYSSPMIAEIEDCFFRQITELGVEESSVVIINQSRFDIEYKPNAPAFCIYLGDKDGVYKDTDIVDRLVRDAILIVPVVSDLTEFSKQVPPMLHGINGFELAGKTEIEALVGVVLEGLGLLRLARRLFISYKRDESSLVAIQLYEQFEKSGFDVFLDTHSIRPGEPFQDELWHRLADTDIVVLLNTPGFLSSHWTSQELAQANAMSIGILQLLWPGHAAEVNAKLSVPLSLKDSDFGDGKFVNAKSYLSADAIRSITSQAEALRARSLASRQDNLTSVFISLAKRFGATVNLQPQKFINFKRRNGKEVVFIPTVGVPQAITYNTSEELVKKIKSANVEKVYLLFDHLNIKENWLKHLSWLDEYLPVKTLKISEAETWIQKNN